MLADDFLPTYDVSDEVATVVRAQPAEVWAALLDADLIELGRRSGAHVLVHALLESVRERAEGTDPRGA